MSRAPERCSHGLSTAKGVYCAQCEIIWHEEGLRQAQKAVQRHTRKLALARAFLANPANEQKDGAS